MHAVAILLSGGIMPSRHEQRRMRTEAAIIDAATALFLERGYQRTSLADIAERAGVAERTLYVRFDSKVKVYQRVVEAAVVGDLDEAPLEQRPWSVLAMTAPTLDERLHAFSAGVAEMNSRLGPLMAVNGEVEVSEPAVQLSAARYRTQTSDFLRAFWSSARNDGLLEGHLDLEWLVETATLLSAAETRLLATRSFAWSDGAYQDWLTRTLTQLIPRVADELYCRYGSPMDDHPTASGDEPHRID